MGSYHMKKVGGDGDNIKVDVKEVWCRLIEMTQYRERLWALVNTVTNIRVLSNLGDLLTTYATISFLRTTPL
jgi:hypothetical protein